MYLRFRGARALALAAVLSGCGGGGGGGGGGGAPPVVTAPSPTPSPSPTAIALSFATQTTADLAAFTIFYDDATFRPIGNAAPQSGFTSRDGVLAPGVTPFQAFTTVSLTAVADKFRFAQGITQHSSQYVTLYARPEARVLTPLTTLLVRHGDQAKLKRQLGIVGSLFGLLAIDPDLNTYNIQAELASGDPARIADAERMAAAILRAQAIEMGFFGPGDSTNGLIVEAGLRVGELLGPRGDLFVFTNERMSSLLAAGTTWAGKREDVRSAAAHLINAFAAAVSVRADRERAATYSLALTGWLRAELEALHRADSASAAAAALAVTSPQIEAEVARYAERIATPITGFYFPGPDFYRVTGAGPYTIEVDRVSSQHPVDGVFYNSPKSNDFWASNSGGSIGLWPLTSTITGVSVPAANASQIAVTRNPNGDIVFQRLNGYRGVSYFDYQTSHTNGGTGSARVYVSFR